jgi:hypothetical protein
MKCEECGSSEDVKKKGNGYICFRCYFWIWKNLEDAKDKWLATIKKIKKEDPNLASELVINFFTRVYNSGLILDEKGVPMNLCELCDNFEGGKKREDNIYVCDECNEKHPLKENK